MADLNPTVMESLISFAYTGQINISSNNVEQLLVASEIFQVSQVNDACVDFFSERLELNNIAQKLKYSLELPDEHSAVDPETDESRKLMTSDTSEGRYGGHNLRPRNTSGRVNSSVAHMVRQSPPGDGMTDTPMDQCAKVSIPGNFAVFRISRDFVPDYRSI